jgi:hypothetical protein
MKSLPIFSRNSALVLSALTASISDRGSSARSYTFCAAGQHLNVAWWRRQICFTALLHRSMPSASASRAIGHAYATGDNAKRPPASTGLEHGTTALRSPTLKGDASLASTGKPAGKDAGPPMHFRGGWRKM